MESILVTGGAGYIGSHICKILKKEGFNPVTVDNLVCGHEWAVKYGPFCKVSIACRDELDAVFKKHKPSAVIHLASHAYVGESVNDPRKYYENNVVGTLKLLDTMFDNNCRKIIFSSSCATYGIPSRVPIKEDHRQQPINPYGWSKLMIERIIKDYHHAYGLSYVLLRYFNAAGADPEGEIGEMHSPETHLIPLAIMAGLREIPSLTVLGNDYSTPDGTAIRDYIHVNDIARAHVGALRYIENGCSSGTYNLGNGKGYSVFEVIKTVEKISKVNVAYEIKERRPGDPERLIASAGSALKDLGWSPMYPDLESIVDTAWNWHSSCIKKYK